MGQDLHLQLGLLIEVMKEYMDLIKMGWLLVTKPENQDLLCAIAAYYVISYAALLRGNKGLLLDLFGLRQHILKGKHNPTDPQVAAPLLGQLKGEDGERYHMLLMTLEMASGLKVHKWLEHLVTMRERQGLFHGPAFCDNHGNVIQMSQYEETFYDILHEIQEQ
jgi:hypothetical protein